MTRHRKGLRPLSQTGFHHIPSNPGQRNFLEGGAKPERTVLASFNEHVEDDRQLHATKGWRRLSVKRGRAQLLMGEIRAGYHRTMNRMGRFIAEGY